MKHLLQKKLYSAPHRTFTSKLVLLLCVTFCMTLLFATQWLQTGLRRWQHDSEALVLGRAYQMQTGVEGIAGLMVKENSKDQSVTEQLFLSDEPLGKLNIYWHGVGLHGTAMGWINRGLCLLGLVPLARLSVLYVVVIWAFFTMLGSVCYWVWREFGASAALLCGVGTLFSSWTLRSIGNLYWITALYFLPFVLSAFLCRRYEASESVPRAAFALVAAGLLLRFLCGFEFVSTTLICMEVPLMYYWAKHPRQSKKWFLAALHAGLFGMAAFALAFAIWVVQMAVGFGSFAEALQEMMLPISLRTGFLADSAQWTGEIALSLQASPLEVVRMYLQDDTILGSLTMQTLLTVYAVVVAATVALCASVRQKAQLLRHAQMLVLCAVALLAPLSWLVLGSAHAYIHTHIDYILWLFPLVPCLLAHLGVCLVTWRDALAGRYVPQTDAAKAALPMQQGGAA